MNVENNDQSLWKIIFPDSGASMNAMNQFKKKLLP